MPNNYYNILYVQLLSWDKNNFARVTSNQKSISKVIFGKTSYKDLDFGQNDIFKACWSSKCVPNTYYNILYVKILSWDQNNIARVAS